MMMGRGGYLVGKEDLVEEDDGEEEEGDDDGDDFSIVALVRPRISLFW